MKLIDKDALVAEIEKLKNELKASDCAAYKEAYIIGAEHTIKTISDVIDTLEVIEIGIDLGDPKGDKSAKYIIDTNSLEVTEVDLEKELVSWRHNHFHGRRDKEASGEYLERVSQLNLAKHFFELGMSVGIKAQKGE